jgi:hypothetical protein
MEEREMAETMQQLGKTFDAKTNQSPKKRLGILTQGTNRSQQCPSFFQNDER